MINEDVRHIIEAELENDERLLWADKPERFPFTPKFHASVFGFVLFIVFFGWAFLLINQLVPWLAFILFVSIFAFNMLVANFQIYGITDKRVIIVNRILWGKVTSLTGGKIWWADRVETDSDARLGTIYLSDASPLFNFKIMAPNRVVWFGKYFTLLRPTIQGLFNVKNSTMVEDLIPFSTLPWKGNPS